MRVDFFENTNLDDLKDELNAFLGDKEMRATRKHGVIVHSVSLSLLGGKYIATVVCTHKQPEGEL